MKRSINSRRRAGFTLFELVVVLAILAVVTTLAIRSLDGLEDQSRYEKNVRGFEELSAAVLGSPDDRAADGTRTVGGFVADMGRLPRAREITMEINGEPTQILTLAELWSGKLWNNTSAPSFDVRPAVVAHGVPLSFEDGDVLISGGWRGPYLRLPIGSSQWLDGWGNPMVTPLSASLLNSNAEGYARLRHINGKELTEAGQEICKIRHLGANGELDASDTYEQDGMLKFVGESEFIEQSYKATLTVQVLVMDGDEEATPDNSYITICVFSPNPNQPNLIGVAYKTRQFKKKPLTFTFPTNNQVDNPEDPLGTTPDPVNWTPLEYPYISAGPRVVRAYLHPDPDPTTTILRKRPKSAVKNVVLRPGPNIVTLTIDR